MTELELYLPGILLAYGAFFVGIASPGPNVLAVMGTSMGVGRRAGMALALGVAFGSFVWAMLTAVGLSALLSVYASALLGIKIGGGLYLLWLAYKAFRSAASRHDIEVRQPAGGERTAMGFLVRGFVIQMTNPKAALAWIAVISLGMSEGAPLWVAAVIVIGTFALSIALHLTYALAFSTPFMIRIYAGARRGIQATLGAFFAIAGIRLLTSRT